MHKNFIQLLFTKSSQIDLLLFQEIAIIDVNHYILSTLSLMIITVFMNQIQIFNPRKLQYYQV